MLKGELNEFVSVLLGVSGLIHHILVPVCACITVLAVGVFLLYEGIRLWKKKSRALSSQQSTPVSDDQVKCLFDL